MLSVLFLMSLSFRWFRHEMNLFIYHVVLGKILTITLFWEKLYLLKVPSVFIIILCLYFKLIIPLLIVFNVILFLILGHMYKVISMLIKYVLGRIKFHINIWLFSVCMRTCVQFASFFIDMGLLCQRRFWRITRDNSDCIIYIADEGKNGTLYKWLLLEYWKHSQSFLGSRWIIYIL